MQEIDLDALKQGDKKEVRNLIIHFSPGITAFLKKKFPTIQDTVDDVWQETLIKAFDNISKFDNSKHLQRWLFKVAVNMSLDKIKRIKIEEKYRTDLTAQEILNFETVGNTTVNYSSSEELKKMVDIIRNYIKNLPDHKKNLLIKRYYLDFTEREIADTLSMNINTVKSYLSKLRKELKEELKPFIHIENLKEI